jgi:hypothetical protein
LSFGIPSSSATGNNVAQDATSQRWSRCLTA